MYNISGRTDTNVTLQHPRFNVTTHIKGTRGEKKKLAVALKELTQLQFTLRGGKQSYTGCHFLWAGGM